MFTTICHWLLNISGWKIEGQLPELPKYVLIVAPHTSNWDFIVGVLARGALATRIHFLGKHQLFIPPWGWLFRAMGGSPVNRSKHNKLVDTAVQLYQTSADYKLALTPEGTRGPVTRWKLGFYHIAHQAQVPIVPVGFDFARRAIVIGAYQQPSGDIAQDVPQLLHFFRGIKGKHPKTIPELTDYMGDLSVQTTHNNVEKPTEIP